jgi:hypothetical protein
MFVVTKCEPPWIYVTSRRTGETYRFLVETDGVVGEEEARFDQGDPRRAAIEYLARFAKTRAVGRSVFHYIRATFTRFMIFGEERRVL